MKWKEVRERERERVAADRSRTNPWLLDLVVAARMKKQKDPKVIRMRRSERR